MQDCPALSSQSTEQPLPPPRRDLGTSLGHLHVLWLARCGLSDLDGIGSFPALKVGLRGSGGSGTGLPAPPR